MLKKAVVGFLCFMGILFIGVIIASRISGSKTWNKEIGLDHHNEFNVAYVDMGDTKLHRIRITSWRDFHDSDQLQFTDDHGTVYLTGADRVVLSSEKW